MIININLINNLYVFCYFVDVIAGKANEDPPGKGDGKHTFSVFFFVSSHWKSMLVIPC